MVSKWMDPGELTKILSGGDLLEFDYPGYSHWGVYVKDSSLTPAGGSKDNPGEMHGDMVHLTRADGKVMLEYVKDQEARGRKNTLLDGLKKPKDAEEICRDALSMVGSQGYNVLSYNCEHLANECRYEDAESGQIEENL